MSHLRKIRSLKEKRSRAQFTGPPPALDVNKIEIEIGSTVEIVNSYTNFSSRFPRTRGVRKPLVRGTLVKGYDVDKFGTVEYIQTTGRDWNRYNKVYFVTDAGFQTWRAASNLSIYNGERGSIGAVTEQEFFHESRSI